MATKQTKKDNSKKTQSTNKAVTEQKKTTTKSASQPKTNNSTKKSSNGFGSWGINKISMYTIIAVALLYVISMILSLVGLGVKAVNSLQGLATAIMITIVSILAWRYVAKKEMVWKILYIICLLLVVSGVIVPLIVL